MLRLFVLFIKFVICSQWGESELLTAAMEGVTHQDMEDGWFSVCFQEDLQQRNFLKVLLTAEHFWPYGPRVQGRLRRPGFYLTGPFQWALTALCYSRGWSYGFWPGALSRGTSLRYFTFCFYFKFRRRYFEFYQELIPLIMSSEPRQNVWLYVRCRY